MGRLAAFSPFVPLMGEVTTGHEQPSPGSDFELVCLNPGWGSLAPFLRDAACSPAAHASRGNEWVQNQ